MKTTLRSMWLFLAAALLASTSHAKTYPVVALDSTGTFTFDAGITRIITNATITVTKGGGWITLTTDTGETDRRYIQQVPPYVATFSKFFKLAKSVTFTAPANTVFTITNLIVQDRCPISFAPSWTGTVQTVDPVTKTLTTTVESSDMYRPQLGIANAGSGCGPFTVNLAIYDANGVFITSVPVVVPVF